MPAATLYVTGVIGTTGALLRARWYAMASSTPAADVALSEQPAGSSQFGGSGTATLADGYYEYEVREVATQDAAGFYGSISIRRGRGSYGYCKAGVWYADAPVDVRLVNGNVPTVLDSIDFTGVGPFHVTENGGAGANGDPVTIDPAGGTDFAAWTTPLLFKASGVAQSGLYVSAYRADAYDALPGSGRAGTTTTGTGGAWTAPLQLSSGDYLIFADSPTDNNQSSHRVSIRVP